MFDLQKHVQNWNRVHLSILNFNSNKLCQLKH